VPADRWLLKALYDLDRTKPGKTYTRRAGFLEQVDGFDPEFFGISAREAMAIDPQQRLLLETSWEALEDAGIVPARLAGSPTGVFVGISTHDYGDLMAAITERKQPMNPYLGLGSTLCIAANRISYCFDLRGPSLSVDTACSSSLVALHLACTSLWQGESELALVGGVNAILKPETTLCFSSAGMLSPDDRCRSFDAEANGYVRAEGAGVVVLKPLTAAERDGDRIYAVILATGCNQDGQTPGISVPSGESQAAVLRQTLARAGVRPCDVQYVEAHGTGTKVGDPIEAQALGTALGDGRPAGTPCLIGSIKSNIGHLEAGAGVAGIVKVALALHHRLIPPSLNFRSPNPQLESQPGLRVVTELQPWPSNNGCPRLAGVNSFGFGGTNAHALLAEAPAASNGFAGQRSAISHKASDGNTYPFESDTERAERGATDRAGAEQSTAPSGTPVLLPLSARRQEALQAMAARYRDYLRSGPGADVSTGDLACTAAVRRTHHPHRLALVAAGKEQLLEQLEAFLAGETRPGLSTGRAPSSGSPPLVFVFTGMGPQWWGMGQQLLSHEPVFRQAVQQCDRLFQQHTGQSLLALIHEPHESTDIEDDQAAQMTIFMLQVGLASLWQSWGVTPAIIIGHSAGEVAAAYAAGALSLEDAVLLSYQRSRLQHRTRGQGKMLAVGLPLEEARRLLLPYPDQVSLAAINGPQSVTLTGDADVLAGIQEELTVEGTFNRMLRVDVPYHSPKLDPLKDEFFAVLSGLSPRPPRIPLYSTVTSALVETGSMDAGYWWQNVREPVQFARVITALLDAGHGLFVEVGPHPVLAASIRECALADDKTATVLPSLRRQEPERATLLAALGQLYTAGFPIDWGRLYADRGRVLSLPTYPWQRERFWRETSISRQLRIGEAEWTATGHFGKSVHPLLGHALSTAHAESAWDQELDLEGDHAWLVDHQVQHAVVFPAAAHVEMGLAAASQLFGPDSSVLEELELDRPLVLSAETRHPVQLLADRGQKSFAIHGRQPEGEWIRYSAGRFGRTSAGQPPAPVDLEQVRHRCPRVVAQSVCYQQFQSVGLDYGPVFQGLEQVWCGDREALGKIAVCETVAGHLADYHVHPAILDACFQTLLGALDTDLAGLYLPSRIDRLRVHAPLAPAARVFWSHARVVSLTDGRLRGDLWLLDEQGRVLVEIRGLRCQAMAGTNVSRGLDLKQCLQQEHWLLAEQSGQPRPETAAWRLPGPRELATAVRPVTAALVQELDLLRLHRQARGPLKALSNAYFIDAVRQLGWDFRRQAWSSSKGLCEHLRVAPQHHRLFCRYLRLLQQEGILEQVEGRWGAAGEVAGGSEALWRQCLARLPGYHSELLLLTLCGSRLAQIMRGEVDALEILFPGGAMTPLEQFYQSAPSMRVHNWMIQQVIVAAVERLPRQRALRILEIGAGTGATAVQVLPVLPAQRTEYVFTDISPQFTAQAEERLAGYPFVRFQTLDIEQDPSAQGFEAHSFDIILASDVLHATADLRRTFASVKKLLASQGLLVLTELNSEHLLPIFGTLKGWWLFTDTDLRAESPLLPGARWCEFLREIGFAEAEYMTDLPDEEQPTQSVLVAQGPRLGLHAEQAADRAPGTGQDKRWLVLADRGGLGPRLAAALEELGGSAVLASPGTSYQCLETDRYQVRIEETADLERLLVEGVALHSGWTGIVDCRGTDLPALEGPAPATLLAEQTRGCVNVGQQLVGAALRACRGVPPRLWLLTRGLQPAGDCRSLALAQAPLWGIGRVLATEHPQFHGSLVDLSPACPDEEVRLLARELWLGGAEEEIALRGEDRYVHRVALTPLAAPLNAAAPSPAMNGSGGVPFRLEGHSSGLLEDLVLRACPRSAPGAGPVEIEVCAAALNFKDVAKAIRLLGEASLEGTLSGSQLGLECAGRVVAVGDGVQGLRVGDSVVGLALGSFASHVITDARLVVPKPPQLTFEEAATLPIAFMTACYALQHLGQLQAGERILIHAASGGLGLAAIQLAQRAGAEIFATAGSADKRRFLRSLGVAHVMDSRSLAFADEILDLTGGQGVDVVLNSLGGQALVRSLSVLRDGGRFLEVGKRDLEANARLGLRPFLKQLSFTSIDLDRLLAARPDLPVALLREVMQEVERGQLRALPHLVFPIGRIQEAFRTLLRARHIGKVVISVREPYVPVQPAPRPRLALRADGTYLITGGLGGFGLAVAEWLVEHGARQLVLAGRSGAASAAAQAAIDRLRQAGAVVSVARADVANAEQLAQLLAEIRRTLPPLRGVIHAAMVLDDGVLLELNQERFEHVMAPKVLGAWNLHVQTRADPLDHFVLFSSCTSIFGNPGQANYVAANLFLDQLAHHRRLQGLPALTVNWGLVGDVGYVAGREDLIRYAERMGILAVPARQFLQALAELLQAQVVQSTVLRADWPALRKSFPGLDVSPRFRTFWAGTRQVETEAATGSKQSLQQVLLDMPPAQRPAKLQTVVSELVAKVLGSSAAKIDPEESIGKLGMDSLMALELVTRIRKEFQVDVPTMTLVGGPSIVQLTAMLLEKLLPSGAQTAESLPPQAVNTAESAVQVQG
jgi:acyl transferase domain-containing protein/NADPH:quinone reductase-like Zn-dependent oxidoreductase/SAM-dependent methyltransferase/acyl carrier protein